MSDFFAELEEDLREERIFALWQKYGNYVIGLALVIVFVTVGYTLWKYIKNQNQLNGYGTFSQALELKQQGKMPEAIKAFQDLGQKGGGYGKLAQLYEAALSPDPETLYAKISQENTTDLALSNLPKILMAARIPGNKAALANLESLTAPNNAWAPLSLELLALANLKNGDVSKAAEQYIRALKDPNLTSYERMRIGMMLSQIDIPPTLLETLTKEQGQK